jgi:hypothetical protein
LALCVPARAQQATAPAAAQEKPQAPATGEGQAMTQAPAPGAKNAAFSPEQLEQIVAPIALYADSLLAHVLMASTYPLEVVSAARWRQKNPKLTGDAMEKSLQSQTWDPSVKSLCTFPDVLARMNENLDWMQDLGDAFLGQQAELMEAVQRMRHKAQEAGTLESGKEQTVSQGEGDTIVIQPADPEVIYVPTYYPSSVYGGWGYPYWYYPPMYAPPPAGGMFFGFTVGVIWGSAWGDCDWGHDEINIDIDNQNNFIDRTERPEQRDKVKDRANSAGTRDKAGNRGSWQHDASHRKGVGYRDSATQQRYGDRAAKPGVSRDQARGYGDRSSTRPSTGGPSASRDGARAGTSDRSSSRNSSGGARTSDRSSSGSTKGSTGERSGSFSGSRNSSMERSGSSRGAQSRGSSGSRGGGGRGGGGRGGGRR